MARFAPMKTRLTPRLTRDERRKQLVASAIGTFARHGYHGTRMEDVARDAGVNVALLYQHFSHKEGLFDAILATQYRDHPMVPRLKELARGTDDEAVFSYYAEGLVSLDERDIAIHRLLLFAALERPELSRRHFEEKESILVAILAGYIEKRIAAGAFRPLDARLAARAFSAQAAYYVIETRVLGGQRWAGYAREDILATMVHTTLDGLRA